MKHLVCWIDIMRISELEYQSILAKRGQPVPIPVVKELPPAAAALARLKSDLSVNAGAKQVAAKGKGSRRGSNAKRSPHRIALLRLQKNPALYYQDREFYDQVQIFRHFELHQTDVYDALASMPNGGLRSRGTGGKLKASGQKKGYPDIILDKPRGRYHGLRIELKAAPDPATGYAGGQLSEFQVVSLNRLHAEGYYSTLCIGPDDAIATITRYLALGAGESMPARETDCLWLYRAA